MNIDKCQKQVGNLYHKKISHTRKSFEAENGCRGNTKKNPQGNRVFNTELRTKVKHDFEKNFFKVIIKSMFGRLPRM